MKEADTVHKKYNQILDMLKKDRLNFSKQISKLETFEDEQNLQKDERCEVAAPKFRYDFQANSSPPLEMLSLLLPR